jgi:SRSO17 transposase
MTEDEVRAAAERLVRFHERFAPLFGKEQAQDHAYTYVKGLMVCPERKSIEPIAINVGDGQVSALQKFINSAPWDQGDVQAEVQSVFVDDLVPTAAGRPIGVVGVVDESGFSKKGDHSAGVARQHNGRLGKEDNCQVGVFLVGVTPAVRRCWTTNSTCPRVGVKKPRRAGTAARRSMSPRRSPSGPSPRSPRV